jgi:hypothetical protein
MFWRREILVARRCAIVALQFHAAAVASLYNGVAL